MNQPGTALKNKVLAGDELKRALLDFAVYDGFGHINEAATLFKLQRRQALKTAKPWEAIANPSRAYPGTSSAAPRARGPAPRTPAESVVTGQDRGNAATSSMMTTAGVLAEAGTHDPVKFFEMLREVIRNSRLAQGLAP